MAAVLAVAVLAVAMLAVAIGSAAEPAQWMVSDESPIRRAADSGPGETVREPFSRSYAFETVKDYRQAIEALEPLLDRVEQQYLVSLRLGWLYYLSGDYQNSGSYYQAAIQAAPAATEPRVGYLLPLLAEQRYGEAETVAQQVLELDPANYYANLRLAYALRLQGQLPAAERIANKMLKLQPSDVSLLSELALVYLAQERQAEARQLFEEIVTLAPSNVLARQQLGLPDTDLTSPGSEAVSDNGCDPRPLTTNVAPYYACLDYGPNSIKSHGNIWGVYGALSARNLLEADYEYTELRFREGFQLEQHDCTLLYSCFDWPHLKLRLGGHVIANNDPLSNGAWTVITGAHVYQTNLWDIGVDTYFTRYDFQPLNKSITQITPHVGIQQFPNACLRMRLDLRAYYINTDHEVAGTGKEDFYSLEARLGLDRDRFGLGVFGWTGEQAFAVRQEGFAVFNLNELHKGGYGGDIRYRFSPHAQATVRVADEYFTQLLDSVETHRLVTMAMWTWTY